MRDPEEKILEQMGFKVGWEENKPYFYFRPMKGILYEARFEGRGWDLKVKSRDEKNNKIREKIPYELREFFDVEKRLPLEEVFYEKKFKTTEDLLYVLNKASKPYERLDLREEKTFNEAIKAKELQLQIEKENEKEYQKENINKELINTEKVRIDEEMSFSR